MDTTFTTGQIKAALSCASDDATRSHLCGIAFADDFMVATDGHRLITLSRRADIPPPSELTIIPSSALETMARAKGARTVRINGVIEARDKVDAVIASRPTVAIDALFPPVSQIIPERSVHDRAPFVGLNPEYLADAGKAFKDAGVTRVMRCQLGEGAAGTGEGGELAPVRFDGDTDDGVHVTLIIMPSRMK